MNVPSVHALYDAARARRLRTEERTIETVALRTEAVASDALALRDVGSPGRSHELELRAARRHRRRAAEIPPNAARGDRLRCDQLRVAPSTSRAAPAPRRPRRTVDRRGHLSEPRGSTTTSWPAGCSTSWPSTAWSLPLGYKDGVFGAERVPSGAYLGDRDMFLFLVDGNRDLDDPTDTSHAGLFRGFILRNSDVGAAALTLDVFLFRAVRQSHHLGLPHVVGFRRRHVGASIQEAWTTSLDSVRTALDADPAHDRLVLLRATSQELGPTRDAVVDAAVQRLELSQKQAAEAYTGGNVRDESPFGLGLRARAHAFEPTHALGWRFTPRSRASRLLTTVH